MMVYIRSTELYPYYVLEKITPGEEQRGTPVEMPKEVYDLLVIAKRELERSQEEIRKLLVLHDLLGEGLMDQKKFYDTRSLPLAVQMWVAKLEAKGLTVMYADTDSVVTKEEVTDVCAGTVSAGWVLNQLAGMSFPRQGQAYDFMMKCLIASRETERESTMPLCGDPVCGHPAMAHGLGDTHECAISGCRCPRYVDPADAAEMLVRLRARKEGGLDDK